jgi:hypothetical protein
LSALSVRYNPHATPSHISTLGIVTADRPQALERCVASYIGHLQRYERSPRILIVDDSRRSANAKAAKQIAEKARGAYRGVIQYVGAREKAAARRILARAGVPTETIDFGLPARGHGFAPGANRNHLLLATAGDLFLTADDDTICRTWRPADADEEIAFVGHVDPRRFAFFTTRHQALNAAEWADIDLFAAHEAMLGRSLTDVAAARVATADVTSACEHIVVGLESQDAAYQIRMSSSGVVGDGAMYSPYRLLFSPTTTRLWTTIDQATFNCALTRRETLRSVARATVTHQSAAMMYSAGIDNRTLTPPFIPIGANEDGLFGVMLRLIAPLTFLAHVPVGVVHDSARGPRYDGPTMPCVSQTRMAELIVALLHGRSSSATQATSRTRLRRLGQHLIALSAMQLDDFAARATATSLELWQREHAGLDAAIARMPDLPSFWLHELGNYRRRLLANVSAPAFFVPIEVKRRDSARSGLRRTQAYLGNLGRLIDAWPEIWSMARREGLYRPS